MTYCTTCGAPDSLSQTSDNHCCSECGDTEGIVWLDDFQEEHDLTDEEMEKYLTEQQ
jgi:hypothetical protein